MGVRKWQRAHLGKSRRQRGFDPAAIIQIVLFTYLIDIMTMARKVNAIVERASDGTYSIYMDADDMGYLVTGTGKTVEEAKACFIGGYEDMKDLYKNEGTPFEEVEFKFVYDTASFLEYYTKAFSLAGLSRITGVAQGQLSHYVTGRKKPNRKTVEKIEKSVHDFAEDLLHVNFA